jgi:hypothetical protein
MENVDNELNELLLKIGSTDVSRFEEPCHRLLEGDCDV